jgi:hypothetical protein
MVLRSHVLLPNAFNPQFGAAQPLLRPTHRNRGDLAMEMRWNAFPIYQTHPAGG